MAHNTVLRTSLCLLVVHSLCYHTLAASFKECTWKREYSEDEGVIATCGFHKCHSDTLLHVYYSGNIRISGCNECCNRWYFTFNNVECSSPGAIDAALHQAYAGNLKKNQHGHIEGYCGGIPAGNVEVKINVGQCVGTSFTLGDAHTGFGSTSRIFVEEVSPSDE